MKRRLQGSMIKYKLIDTILSPVKRFKYKKPNFQINVYPKKVILCYIYQPELINMLKRFQACMLLAVVGDAIGYKRGQWEFNYNGLDIHKQMM